MRGAIDAPHDSTHERRVVQLSVDLDPARQLDVVTAAEVPRSGFE